ncbi:velvet factor [Mycena rebaudengoi]|nr:velvet factor [Mycena rebaudengoi]
MIQHINPRKTATAVAPMRQTAVDGPEQWGKWIDRKYYSLEMVQHPLRARMCGFGDKDRRPLAPAAVARMVVKRDDNSLVDVDDVDCSFFLVTVDLWSEDGKHERNLVLHPSAGDRYVPIQSTKQRRRGGSSTVPPRSGHQTPRSTPTPSQFRGGETPTTANAPMGYNSQGYFPPQSPLTEPVSFTATASYGSSTSTPTWGYPSHSSPPVDRNTTYPPPILPSIHSFGRPASPAASDTWHPDSEPTYRPWNTDSTSFAPAEFGHPPVDPALKSDRDWSPYPSAPPTSQQYDPALYGSSQYSHQPSQQQQMPYFSPAANYPQQSASSGPPPAPTQTMMPAPGSRNAYTRTLVGPLSSNGYRLLDEHRKPGIFFLFQDLSVRTEGTFRLRLRLMNVGAPPAPEPGALQVHTGVSPVLAQIFSEPFTVYSAKRFPGVPDTTALSIAFGNQGLKLPLRNRHGSSKRRRDDSGSDDDSDGG